MKNTKVSLKVLSLFVAVLMLASALPLSNLLVQGSTIPTTLDVASPVTHASDSARNYKYQTTTVTDGAQSVYQLNCPAASYTSYFIPALDTTGTAYNGVELEPNTYYLVSFKYKVANIPENKSVYLGIGRVGAERMSTDGVYVYADLGKVRKFDSTTEYKEDKTNLITLSAVQNEYAEYKLLFKTKENLETVSNSLYNDLIIITASTGGSSDRFAYKINIKDLIVKKANALENVEVYGANGSLMTTIGGFNGESFDADDLPALAPSQDYYTDPECITPFTSGVFGTTKKVYITKADNNLYYADKIEYAAGFDTSGISYNSDNQLVATNKDKLTISYQPKLAGAGFELKPSTYYSISFKYKLTEINSEYVYFAPVRYSMDRVNQGGQLIDYINIDAGRIYRLENSTTLASANNPSEFPESVKLTAVMNDFETYTYSFVTPADMTYKPGGTQFDLDSLFITARASESNKKFTIIYDDLEIVEDSKITAISFVTNGGSDVAEGNKAFIKNVATYTLPTPTKAGYNFTGWFTDATCKDKFVAADYVRTNGLLTLYAGWKDANEVLNGTEISDFISFSPYSGMQTGQSYYNNASLRYQTLPEGEYNTDSTDNGMLKYYFAYEDGTGAFVGPDGKDEDGYEFRNSGFGNRGNSKGTEGRANAGAMLLMSNPSSPDGYEPYKLEIGKNYYVTFDYYVKTINPGNQYKGDSYVSIGLGRVKMASDTKYYVDSIDTSGTNVVTATTASSKWQKGSYIFTPYDSSKLEGDRFAMNRSSYNLALLMSGYGEVYVDNFKIYCLEDNADCALLVFEANGGSKCENIVYKNGDKLTLPTTIKENAEFDGWYTDVELTKKFSKADLKDKSGVVKLYAKWLGIETDKIDFSNTSFYNNGSNRVYTRAGYRYSFVKDSDGNDVLKYKYGISEKEIQEPGNASGTGGKSASGLMLFKPQVVNTVGYSLKDAYYTANDGYSYQISFRYKVLSVGQEQPGHIAFRIMTTAKENSWTGAGYQDKEIFAGSSVPTDKWMTASTIVTMNGFVENKKDPENLHNVLALGVIGHGECLIDDITITALNGACVAFDTYNGSLVAPISGKVGQTVAVPEPPTKEDSTFLGWYKDPLYFNAFDAKTVTLTKQPQMLYAKFAEHQVQQDFESYHPIGTRFWWSDMSVNEPAFEEYDPMAVKTGSVSIKRNGEAAYGRQATLFTAEMGKLALGETYTLQFWARADDIFLETSAISLRHCPLFDWTYSDSDTWKNIYHGALSTQSEPMILLSEFEVGEWKLVTYEFKARAPFVAIVLPEFSPIYIDNATITWSKATEYKLQEEEKKEETVVETVTKKVAQKIDLSKYMTFFDNVITKKTFYTYLSIAGAAAVIVITGLVLLVVFLAKKKKRNNK